MKQNKASKNSWDLYSVYDHLLDAASQSLLQSIPLMVQLSPPPPPSHLLPLPMTSSPEKHHTVVGANHVEQFSLS